MRRLLARLRVWLRPPRTLRVTRIGRTYLVLTFGVGFGALNTGNNLLYLVLGLLLSLIVVSGVLSERCLRGLRVTRLGAEAAFAGEPFAFRWTLERQDGHAFALAVSEADVPLEGEASLAVLAPGKPASVRAELQAARRGVYPLRAVRVTTTYPLGLFAKSRWVDLPGTLTVYPRRRAAGALPVADASTGAGGAGAPARGQGSGDVFGVAELREGEDARHIHWLKSAAVGALVRTERERDERRSVTLRVDPRLPLERLDTACEQAAAAANALLARGFDVGLTVGATRLRPAPGPAQSRRILEALAWAGAEERV